MFRREEEEEEEEEEGVEPLWSVEEGCIPGDCLILLRFNYIPVSSSPTIRQEKNCQMNGRVP
jgi:hypothetical protein